jgi:hypothetical protein
MGGFENDVMVAKNMNFDEAAAKPHNGIINAAGKLPIGTGNSSPIPEILAGSLTSPLGTLSIGYASPNITLDISGGAQAVEHLTGDTGGQLNPDASHNFNLFGQAAGSTTVFDTIGSGSTISFENRAWLSRYVVDTSTTVGTRGTYSTLQAAITQAIADGITGVGATIYIRNCTISETITFSTASAILYIIGTSAMGEQSSTNGPTFSGSFTNSGSGNITFANLNITGTLTNSSTGNITVNNSIVAATLVNSNASGNLNCTQCFCSSITGTLSGGQMSFTYCGMSGGTITLSNAASLAFLYSVFSGTIAGTTSGSVSFNNSYIPLAGNTLAAGTFINFNSTFGTSDYYGNSALTYQMSNSTAGNTYQAVRSAVSYVVIASQDYYIGITSTASARTVTLPSTNIIKNQSFIIKDESGAAGTNNISVTVNGGVKTIDGVTTYAITNNYGSIQVIYDGTNYFVI